MQRGLVITFAASANKARERAARSLIPENALGGRKCSEISAIGCAHARQFTSVATHVAAPKLFSVDDVGMTRLFAIPATPCGTTLTHQGQRSMVGRPARNNLGSAWVDFDGSVLHVRQSRSPPGALTISRVSSGRARSAARARRSSSASGGTASFARMIERAAAGAGLELKAHP
jgi:hypothetical protein